MTIVAGNLMAIPQQNVKRLLAYSGVAHIGYMLIGIAAVSADGAGDGALLPGRVSLREHGRVPRRAGGRHGPRAATGWAAIAASRSDRRCSRSSMLVFLLSLGGIPFVAGFWAKLFIFQAAIERTCTGSSLLGAVLTIVALYYYLVLASRMYIDAPERAGPAAGPVPPQGLYRWLRGRGGRARGVSQAHGDGRPPGRLDAVLVLRASNLAIVLTCFPRLKSALICDELLVPTGTVHEEGRRSVPTGDQRRRATKAEAAHARPDPGRGGPPDPPSRVSLHLAGRRPPGQRGGQGQLLLLLQEQGRPRLRHHRPDRRASSSGRWSRPSPTLRRTRRPDPRVPRPRPGQPAPAQLRRRVPDGQPRLRAVGRARGFRRRLAGSSRSGAAAWPRPSAGEGARRAPGRPEPAGAAQFLVAALEGAILLSKVTKDIAVMEKCVDELKSHLTLYAER